MSEINAFVLVIDTDHPDCYHNGLRVTVHATPRELMEDAAEFVEEQSGNLLEEAIRFNDGKKFCAAMDRWADGRNRKWTCYHPLRGWAQDMFDEPH